jgi:hypothetical protein
VSKVRRLQSLEEENLRRLKHLPDVRLSLVKSANEILLSQKGIQGTANDLKNLKYNLN